MESRQAREPRDKLLTYDRGPWSSHQDRAVPPRRGPAWKRNLRNCPPSHTYPAMRKHRKDRGRAGPVSRRRRTVVDRRVEEWSAAMHRGPSSEQREKLAQRALSACRRTRWTSWPWRRESTAPRCQRESQRCRVEMGPAWLALGRPSKPPGSLQQKCHVETLNVGAKGALNHL